MTRVGAALLLAGMAGLGVGWPAPPPASAQPRALAGRDAPIEIEPAVVVDSLGRLVGQVVVLSGFTPLVRLPAGGTDVLMIAFGDRLAGLPFLAEYETPDCTGAPWLPALLQVPLMELAAVGRLTEVLVADGDAVTRTVQSTFNTFRDPPACDPIAPGEDRIVRPTRVLTVLGSTFTPPFRMR
jgi:hypothetical protein